MSSSWGPSYGDPSHPTTGELPRVGDGRVTDEVRTVQVDTVGDPVAPVREPSRPRWEPRGHGSRHGEPSPPRHGADANSWSSSYGQSGPNNANASNRFRYSWETAGPGGEPSAPRFASRGEPSAPRSRFATSAPRTGYSEPRFEPPATRFESPATQFEPSAPRGEPSRPRGDDTTQFARVGDGLRGSVGPVTVQIDQVQLNGGRSPSDTQLLPTSAFMRPAPEPIPEAVETPQPEPTGSMPAMRRQMGPDWTQTPLRLLAAAVVATAVLGASAAGLITIGNWINP